MRFPSLQVLSPVLFALSVYAHDPFVGPEVQVLSSSPPPIETAAGSITASDGPITAGSATIVASDGFATAGSASVTASDEFSATGAAPPLSTGAATSSISPNPD
ncbi:hypothetical protein DL96DRAFT_1703939 [Flagelloscypha sp. PMI_526]|nr:hypothetical protein DL96DRAFT_1703939 [Flagelloscypha sp. PMI_526]